MRVNAYLLAADPTWIEPSVRSYYGVVEKIFVSYDRDKIGWTGAPIAADECIERIRAIDVDRKVRLVEGSFFRKDSSPMENDTAQRQHALTEAGKDADWVVELDTDEVMPDAPYFVDRLREVPPDREACMWPMRVMFKQLSATSFLEVSTRGRTPYSEYPGPVACRPGVKLIAARRSSGPQWRHGIRYGWWDYLVRPTIRPDALIEPGKAVLHFSWARNDDEIRRKLSSWSHARDFDREAYLNDVWRASESRWRSLRNFHPVQPALWPALRIVDLPPALCARPTKAPGKDV